MAKKKSMARRRKTAASAARSKKRSKKRASSTRSTNAAPAADSNAAEIAYQEQALRDNRQLNTGGPLKSGETHTLETDAGGNRIPVRRRFSAV